MLKDLLSEEIAWRNGWIDDIKLAELSKKMIQSNYGKYLIKMLDEKNN